MKAFLTEPELQAQRVLIWYRTDSTGTHYANTIACTLVYKPGPSMNKPKAKIRMLTIERVIIFGPDHNLPLFR